MQSKKYNVSPKSIRDILNRRTWTKETRHLWAQDQPAGNYSNSHRTTCPSKLNVSNRWRGSRSPSGEMQAYLPFDDDRNCTHFHLDEKMLADLNSPDLLTFSSAFTIRPTSSLLYHLSPRPIDYNPKCQRQLGRSFCLRHDIWQALRRGRATTRSTSTGPIGELRQKNLAEDEESPHLFSCLK
jgi:hypothetical protein